MLFIEISVSWSEFKTKVSERSLIPQWYALANGYRILAKDDYVLFSVRIEKAGTDKTDFENNYKNNWNKPLNLTENKYMPALFNSAVDNSISAGQTKIILDEDMIGKLDEIMIKCSHINMEVSLNIDSVKIYTLKLEDLKDAYKNDSILVDSTGEQFFHKFIIPIDIGSNITIEVKNLDSVEQKVNAYMVQVRKLVKV